MYWFYDPESIASVGIKVRLELYVELGSGSIYQNSGWEQYKQILQFASEAEQWFMWSIAWITAVNCNFLTFSPLSLWCK